MMVFNRDIMGKRIQGTADRTLASQMEWLFDVFEQIDVPKWVDGFCFQVGWMLYVLREKEAKCFVLEAPDVDNNPFTDRTEDLTTALRVNFVQGQCLQLFDVGGASVRFDDKIIVANGVFDCDRVYLHRTESGEPGDSGWYIGPVSDSEPTDFSAIYVYELLRVKQAFMRALLLPDDYMVIFDGDTVTDVVNADNVNVLESVREG